MTRRTPARLGPGEAAALGTRLQVVQCERCVVGNEIADADVIVPLMSRLDATLLRRAARARLILQFGVGVEGVDIAEASGVVGLAYKCPSLSLPNGAVVLAGLPAAVRTLFAGGDAVRSCGRRLPDPPDPSRCRRQS